MSDTRGAQRRPNNRGAATSGGGGKRVNVNANGGAAFKTDTDISRAAANAGERELQPWMPDSSNDSGADGLGGLDDETFGAVSGGLGAGKGNGGGGTAGWDQFATNAKLFGQSNTTPYSEELYTTRLNRSSHNFREREREAERLAREIEQGVSDNPHIKEERGQVLVGAGDEEERFSGVVRTAEVNTVKVAPGRGKGAYVPFGARAGDAAGEKDMKKKKPVPVIALQAPSTAGTPAKLPITIANPASSSANKPTTPTPLTNASSTNTNTTTLAVTSAAPAARTDITHSLRSFADAERSKIAAVKADFSKTERERRLAELVAFGREFKVPPKWSGAPGSEGKEAVKEKESAKGQGKKDKPAAVNGTGITKPGPTNASSAGKPSPSIRIAMRIPEIPPFKGSNSARVTQPALPTLPAPTATAAGEGKVAVPATADRSVPVIGSSPVGNGQGLQLQPQGDDKKEKKDSVVVAPASGAGAKMTGGQAGGRLNPAASAFTFKPNPTASAFRPLGNAPPVVNGARNGPSVVAGGVSPNATKGLLPGHVLSPAATPVTGPTVSPAHAQTVLASPQQLQQQQGMTNAFFVFPLKRTPGVNIRDDFNPIRARRAVSAPVPRPEDQMQHPTGMYNLHMNGIVVNPALAMHGGGGGPPPSAATPGPGGGAPNGMSPHIPIQGLEDERFSPSPQLGIGPGGPGGFNRMPHQAMQPMGQPGMYFINGPMMQGMPYNPQMMPGSGGPPVRPGAGMYYPQQQQPGQGMSSHRTIFQHYLPFAARFREYTAFVDGLSGRTISSTQLRIDALRLGRGIQKILPQNCASGGEPAVALIFSPNSVDFPQIFFGCQSVKVITSLANAGYTANELAHQIRDGQPFVAFVHPSLQETFLRAIDSLKAEGFHAIPTVYWAVPGPELPAGVTRDVLTYDRLMVDHIQIKDYQGIQARADEARDTALLCYSSGTVSPYPPVVVCLNFHWIAKRLGIIPLLNGVPVVILPGFTPERFFSTIARYRITHAYVVPPIVIHMANSPLADDYDLSNLKWTRSAAAPLGKEVVAKVKARFGDDLIMTQGYGLTESTAVCACQTVEESETYPGSTGTLYPTLEARLLDTDLRDVAPGEAGELCLRGPTVMKYELYFCSMERSLTKADLAEATGIIQWQPRQVSPPTGGIVLVISHSIVDRLKELIKYNGFQVAPAELEAMLLKHPKIADVAVIGVVSRERATELPRAYVVPLENGVDQKAQNALTKEIIAWVADNVSDSSEREFGSSDPTCCERRPIINGFEADVF
ncbi:hypothetical protein QFC22_000171 [Naganishia vaughanmartiniae]|uniref:Uncharacterized protein n=1 Tax=Naganishia vaughanmartiniae TaxID=1424756 RepID=A0ACC2XPM9_9TREE|nr:hypothetical protein QFC22_000171 [Naganishia vaughanmartiniae]